MTSAFKNRGPSRPRFFCPLPSREFPCFLLLFIALLYGCATSSVRTESLDYRARAETDPQDGVRVSAVVLSSEETLDTFSLPLAQRGFSQSGSRSRIMRMKSSRSCCLALIRTTSHRRRSPGCSAAMANPVLTSASICFWATHPLVIPPHRYTVSGFVYTNLDPGAKAFAVELAR